MTRYRSLPLVLLLCLTQATSSAQEPVGSIVAWHQDFPYTPGLPSGWTRMDGQVLNNPASPFHGIVVPDLNGSAFPGSGRFLRGDTQSGFLEADAIQGHFHGNITGGFDGNGTNLCPVVLYIGGGEHHISIGTVKVEEPIGDGQFGPPRVDSETRPVNMSVVWILKTESGPLPVGSIVAWHRNLPGLATRRLPRGWVLCDGRTVEDPDSPYFGIRSPDLIKTRSFLRGGLVSGLEQSDAFQDHRHRRRHSLYRLDPSSPGYIPYAPGGVAATVLPAELHCEGAKTDPRYGTVRVAEETRPKNLSVLWILKTSTGASLPPGSIIAQHSDPGVVVPAPGIQWFPCDGRTVSTPWGPTSQVTLPDLNGDRRFLRGDSTSGILEEDAFQGHSHRLSTNGFQEAYIYADGDAWWGGCGFQHYNLPKHKVTIVTGARVDSETRPVNMHVPLWLFLPRRGGPTALPANRTF